MNNRPYGYELLEIARRTLLTELLPLLSSEKNHDARMIANAMAMAARELQANGSSEKDGAGFIAEFFQGTDSGVDLVPNEEALAGLIRSRGVEPARVLQLHELLMALTRIKLAISNPKYFFDD